MGSREHIIVTITDLPDSFIFVAMRTLSFQSRGEFEPFPPIFSCSLSDGIVTLFYKMVTLFYKMVTLFYKMLTLFYNMLTLF